MTQENFVNNDWRRRAIRYAPLFFWIAVILYLGSAQGAMSETSRFIGPLLRFLFPDAAPETLAVFHGYIRKFAHLFEYGVLAAIALLAFSGSDVKALRRHRYGAAMAVVLIVAAIDETSQSTLASRTGTPWDVGLDALGGAIVLSFLLLFELARIRKRRKAKLPIV